METKDTIYVSWRRLRCLTEHSKHATENKLINTNMEFEDYEDMFTFEEWSFQHPPSDGNDAKTFDELCEEVLRLSYACDKEDSVVHESPSNVSEVSSKKYEEPKVEHVHAVEILITSDTSLTSHLKPGRDCHFHQDFVAGGAQTINDFILSAEKHETCPQYSSEKSDVPTAMINAEEREAQCLKCKLVSKNSKEGPTQVAMNMTNVKESSLDPNLHPSYNASSEDENPLQSSTDTLQDAPKQTPSKNVIVSREETEVLISIDTNGENTQPGNCRSKKHVSVASQIQSDAQNVCSGITTSFLANIHIENESSKEAVNSCGVLDDEYGSKSQNTMLEFQIKVDVNREIKSVCESKENQYDITLGLADSQNTQLKSTSVKENLSSNLVSEQATSLSPINYSSQTSEIAKVDCATDAARNGINDGEASEEKLSSPETFHKSPSSEATLLTSFPPNQKMDEERNDEITTKSNADNSSNIITCDSESAEVLSPKVSKLNYEAAGSEVYPNSDINVDTSMNFKNDKNQTFDSIFNINDVDVNTEISFCQNNSLKNKLEGSVQSVELSKIQQESENRVVQDARTVKSKLVLRRTRNEASNLDSEQIIKISNESPQNYFESKKRRFKLRPPVAQERIKTYSNKKRAEKLLQSTCEKKAAYISSDKHTTSTTNDSEKEVITLSKSASMGSQVMDEEDLKSITLDIQDPESKFESLIEIITPENWKMTDDSKTFSPNFSVSPAKESLTNAGKEEVILPTLNSKEHETVITKSQPEVQKNNTSNEVIYLRTTDTISVTDKTITSSTPITSEKNNCEQTSTATIEINTNKQFSKGTLRTVINVKHNSISPDGESTCIIHQSDTSGEERIMASRTRGAARIVPFSRYVGSPLALGPYRSTLHEPCTIGTAHRTNVRSLEKESDFHSYQRNVANDSNDEVIVTESNEQPGRVLQPKAYERKIIRYDYITPKIVNRDPRSRKRAADHLTPEVNETSSQVSPDNKSEGTTKEIIYTSNKDPIMSLPKKSRLVSSEKSLIVDGNSGNDSSIQSKMDIGKIGPLEIDSQNEIQNSKNLENTSKKQLEKPSMPSILLTQEDENLEEGTTRIIHRVENQCNLTSRKIYKIDNIQGENTSNMSESFCHNPFSDSSSNIFNDETIKAICASEKAETSIRSPAQYIESGKSFVAEPTKNLRHPSRNSRGGIIRRSFDSVSEPSSSTRKSRVDILRSQAKFLKSCPHRSSSPNVKPESKEQTCIQTALISSHPRPDSQVKQKPSTEGSKTSEGDPPASEPPRTSSSTESGIGACPVHFGNASTTRPVRRLRRTSAPCLSHTSPLRKEQRRLRESSSAESAPAHATSRTHSAHRLTHRSLAKQQHRG